MIIVLEINLGLLFNWFIKLSEFYIIFLSVLYGNVIEKFVNNLFLLIL